MLPEKSLNVAHDLCDPLFLLQNAGSELFGRQMGDVVFGTGVFLVEITVVFEQLRRGNFPRSVVLSSLIPPRDAVGEFLKLNRGGLGVVLSSLRQWLLVVPDILRGAGSVEEQNVCGNAGLGSKHAVGQSHDRVQIEFLQQFFLNATAHAFAK